LTLSCSTATAVLHTGLLYCSIWYQNTVPCQEPFRIQLFQMNPFKPYYSLECAVMRSSHHEWP
jgi:hypothetical protein